MKTRTIWVLSGIFALITTFALYGVLFGKSQKTTKTTVQPSSLQTTAKNPVEASGNPKPFQIEQGKRAVSVAVNDVQGISGYLAAGDYVDVVAMVPPPQGENATAQILMQNVKVLAVGMAKGAVEKNSSSTGAAVYRTVTLEVSPMQGGSLAFALQKGSIALMLRKNGDHSIVPATVVTQEELNKGVAPK